jgi:hypothetical protein
VTGQERLDGMPVGNGRIWRAFQVNGVVAHGKWLRACAEGAFVGDCHCGGLLAPAPPVQVAGRTDYLARCRSPGCGAERLAPGGRVLNGSASQSRRPKKA